MRSIFIFNNDNSYIGISITNIVYEGPGYIFYCVRMAIVTLLEKIKPIILIINWFPFNKFPCTEIKSISLLSFYCDLLLYYLESFFSLHGNWIELVFIYVRVHRLFTMIINFYWSWLVIIYIESLRRSFSNSLINFLVLNNQYLHRCHWLYLCKVIRYHCNNQIPLYM